MIGRYYNYTSEEDTEYYIPGKMKIGKFDVTEDNKNPYFSDVGFPSCRFKLRGWTDMNTFERLTKYRPTNMADKRFEIEKMISGSVFEIDNEPTDGMKFLGVGRSDMYNSNSCFYYTYAYIMDPRGFAVQVILTEFMDMLSNCHVSIDSEGVIGGKLCYMWEASKRDPNKENGWTLVSVLDDRYKKATTEKMVLEEMNVNPGVKSKDFVPGKVYDYLSGFKVCRVLYVGKMDIFSSSALKKYFELSPVAYPRGYFDFLVGSGYGNVYTKRCGYLYNQNTDPWDIPDLVDILINGLKEFKNVNVFLRLEPSNMYSSHNSFYLENLLNGEDNTYRCGINLQESLTVLSGGRNMIGLSENQDITIEKQEYYSYKRDRDKSFYRKYSFDDILKAIDIYKNRITNMIEECRKIYPSSAPPNVRIWKDNFVNNFSDNADMVTKINPK